MIDFKQAAEQVNKRLARAGMEGETVQMDTARFMCIGTDVSSIELRKIVDMSVTQVIRLIDDGDEDFVTPALAGLVVRSFWLGYAYGEASE